MVASVQPRVDEIVTEAARMFRAKGYPGSTMRELAHRLGVEGGSLYYHISGKDEILWRACREPVGQLVESTREIVGRSELSCRERLELVIANHVTLMEANLDRVAVFLLEARHLDDAELTEIMRLRHEYELLFRRVLEDGVERGEFDIEDVQVTAYLLLGMYNWLFQWYSPHARLTAAKVARLACRITFDGIAHR